MARQTTTVDDAAAAAARGARRLTRGITATWWYTLTAIVFFELMVVFILTATLLSAGLDDGAVAAVGIGGVIWSASTVPLLFEYRHRSDSAPLAKWRRALVPLLSAAAYGVLAGTLTGIWVVALLPLLQSLVLLNWQPGVRLRVVLTVTGLLVGLWVVDARLTFADGGPYAGTGWSLLAYAAALLPAMTVVSLWWWDVLITLDRARASEARLAATQERLRVATDVHDLQGHHLQVIALQLELAERLMDRDPEAALEQLRAGRASVDEARQGTRDLATRFRSVPLRDELANAADLLRAAGTATEVFVDDDADLAPADVLGPVIRETTTNVLRHGDGQWARLALTREEHSWRYDISNDRASDASPRRGGSGLEGLERRAAEAGGTLDVRAQSHEFRVTVTVPERREGQR